MCAISWAQPFHLSDSPPCAKISISAAKFHSAFRRVSMHRNCPHHRSRILLKSARNESGITESSQISENKLAGSTESSQISENELAGSENASSTSTSFLSVLCPLLRFFGVRGWGSFKRTK